MRRLLPLVFVIVISWGPARAQTQCGLVDTIGFPVDTSVFRLVQDYAAPSPRHQGRYHLGEDWYGGRGMSLGQPVRAIASGRVTYASAIGWGRDGGVVIVEHTFPDSSVAYSVYGHMMETETVKFPRVFSCVRAGEIIGVVGDVRPAPHLHLEIRVNNPDIPGPGYLWEEPTPAGWRRPSKFILNWQTWLQPAFRWRLDLADETGPVAPPVELADHSLLYLDANRLGRVTSDGRSLWRVNLARTAVALVPYQNGGLLVYADGGMQPVNLDGTLAEGWETGVAVDSPPLMAGDAVLFHTPDDALVVFDSAQWGVRWRLEGVPPFVRGHAAAQVIGLITAEGELLTVSRDGRLLDRARLREGGDLDTAVDGSLLAYTRGGLWTILADGVWTLALPDAPPGGGSGALLVGEAGKLYLFDGRILHAYSRDRQVLWQIELGDVTGMTELTQHGPVLLLTSTHGHLVAVQEASGALCNRTRIFGDWRSRAWHSLGADGVLRVAVADQILGLDWRRFIGGCG